MWPLYTVETRTWHSGNIGLIGDAAHAMLPFQAQGAAMGIEDAAVLAPLLMTEPTAEAAFARYEALRQARVARVPAPRAPMARIFHMPWPLSIARNLVIAAQGSTGHLRRLDWLYGYDPRTAHGHRQARLTGFELSATKRQRLGAIRHFPVRRECARFRHTPSALLWPSSHVSTARHTERLATIVCKLRHAHA